MSCGVYAHVILILAIVVTVVRPLGRTAEVESTPREVQRLPVDPPEDETGSTVPTEFKPTTATCRPQVHGANMIPWRMGAKVEQLALNLTSVACYTGDHCPLWNNRTQEASSWNFVTSFDLQLGDEVVLWIATEESNGNVTTHVTVTELPAGGSNSCDVKVHPILLSTDATTNITLRRNILKIGENVLFVRYSNSESECDIIWRLKVSVKDHGCSKNRESALCSGKGTCFENSESNMFSCTCCAGFVGKFCEERDGCYGNPCQHGGFCVDIAEGLDGSTFQCLCPHGYRGRSCEDQVNLCDRRPCLNNGTCYGNQTDYKCDCPKGFAGPDCETNINECLSNPCVHGVCEDGIGAYKCYCLPGYGGDHCEFEYDECDSNPCINGGACEDLVAGYRCHCGPGYRGRRCQNKVDLCQANPCPPPAQCVDRGNNYSCVCHPEYNGPGCTQHYHSCYPNPCQNSGSCWPSLDSYFCSCRPGYTGDLCDVALYPSQPLPRTLEEPGEPEERVTTDPANGSVDHLHNVYIAAFSLAGTCLVVVLVVAVCHCRTKKTYQLFTRRLSRSCSEIKQQKLEDRGKFSLNLHGSASEGQVNMDATYEASNVDVVDSLNAPLIN